MMSVNDFPSVRGWMTWKGRVGGWAEEGADSADGQVVVGAGVEVVREVSFVVEGHEAEAVARAEP